jgi:hypothetical protein
MKKTKRFERGGDVDSGYVTNEDSNSGMREAYDKNSSQGLEINNRSKGTPRPLPSPVEAKKDMGDYVPQSSSETVKAKNRIVTKEELAKSGMSLRDFLNKERGLVAVNRPKSSSPSAAPSVPAVAAAPSAPATPSAPAVPSAPASASAPKGSTYRDFKGKIQRTTEDGPSAVETIGKGIGSAASSAASGIGDYFKNYETPAEHRSRKNKEEKAESRNPKKVKSADMGSDFNTDALSTGSAMKRGGSVKKMATGGMASSRADGIAQRGKTRGKMC